jgi:uncharacterized protein DUF6221
MDDLSTWLLEQIAEDDRLAKAATPGPWQWDGDAVDQVAQSPDYIARYRYIGWDGDDREGVLAVNGEHIAAWDPARVLAECEAKRRVLQRHQPVEQWHGHGQYRRLYRIECSTCLEGSPPDDPNDPGCYHGNLEWPCPEIRDAASPYADRPGYQEEWKP